MALPNQQKQNSEDSIPTQNVNESNLLIKLRTKYRYGEIIVVMHDGKPVRLKQIEIYDDLHGDLSTIEK